MNGNERIGSRDALFVARGVRHDGRGFGKDFLLVLNHTF